MLEICNNGSDQQRNLAYIEKSINPFSSSSVTRDSSDLGQIIGDYSDRDSVSFASPEMWRGLDFSRYLQNLFTY